MPIIKPQTDAIVTAGESLAANAVICLGTLYAPNSYADLVAGRAYASDKDLGGKHRLGMVLGVLKGAINENDIGEVRTLGPMGGFTGLTAGRLYRADGAGSGALEQILIREDQQTPFVVAISATEGLVFQQPKSFLGSGVTGGPGNDAIYILDFSSGVPRASYSVLPASVTATAWCAGSNGKAYMLGANSSVATAILIVCSETVWAGSNLSGNLTHPNCVASQVAGYTGPRISTQYHIEKYAFSNDAVSDAGIDFATAYVERGGASAPLKGYFGGGVTGTTAQNVIEAISFSDDSIATLAATLTVARRAPGATANATKIYWGGGYTGAAYSNVIDALSLSNETVADVGDLLEARNSCPAFSSGVSAYWCAGVKIGGSNSSTMDIMSFSNETPVDAGEWPVATGGLRQGASI